MSPIVSLVAAVARNGVIGRDNGLAWHLSSDLKRFKALTMGKPMLMGRRISSACRQTEMCRDGCPVAAPGWRPGTSSNGGPNKPWCLSICSGL